MANGKSGKQVSSRAVFATSALELGSALRSAVIEKDAVSLTSLDRVAAAVDASHYLLTPSAVVRPKNAAEVAAVLAVAAARREVVNFRSGGTSLSGQGVTDGIMIDTRRNFGRIVVLDEGARVRVEPGATVRQVNARLMRKGRKLGPDPASEIACTIGGVLANNSSGMSCGIEQNSYRTLESLVVVLPSGTTIDTAAPNAEQRLALEEPQLAQTLIDLHDRVASNPTLVAEIRRQHAIKNTMGYGLNALIDFDSPVQILAHLLIGSEGTLGFIAEATLATVPLKRCAATAFLVFESLTAATAALPLLVGTGAAAIELLDASSLRVAQADPDSAAFLPALSVVDQAALLVEYQALTEDELDADTMNAQTVIDSLSLVGDRILRRDATVRAGLWHIRKGLYATVAGARPSGTTALLEDIAVPVAALADTCRELQTLFQEFGYDTAVIFGHAKDGNIHFLLTEDFELPGRLDRYRQFTDRMVDLVLARGGTLKAEHGTGRIMAPFVRRQYGDELFAIMMAIKSAFDPQGTLNPDVVLTLDPELHLKNVKSTPSVESEVDRCVECGYCEPGCPSRGVTTTPRQRIVVRRALADARARGDSALVADLESEQQYQVIQTCAVDGMCETACPVHINTGDLVRRLRAEGTSAVGRTAWKLAAKHWDGLTAAASSVMTLASAVPASAVVLPNTIARKIISTDLLPLWSPELPGGGTRRPFAGSVDDGASAVVFSACVGTMFGAVEDSPGVAAAFQSLLAKAGVITTAPEGLRGLCCGTPWKSKGMVDGYTQMVQRTITSLLVATGGGRLPVICDNSSCTEGLVHALEAYQREHPLAHTPLRFIDAVDFVAEEVLNRIEIFDRLNSIALHPTCSSARLGSNSNLRVIAEAVSKSVTVPDDWGCCGFAGDRGLLHPELTASATQLESAELSSVDFDDYVSCNRTCEIGMTRATGYPYRHVLELLDERSR